MKYDLSTIFKATLLATTISTLYACGGGSDSSNDDNDTIITDSAPVVDAGASQSVSEGDNVTISASVTDDGTYTVSWEQTAGTTVTLSDTSSETVSFVAPQVDADETLTFEITVDDGVNQEVTDSVSVTVTDQDTPVGGGDDDVDLSAWIVNTTGKQSEHILHSSTGIGVEVNVQSVDVEEEDGVNYIVVNSQGIPDYDVTITQEILDGLTERPRASSDFVSGAPTVSVGDEVSFGEDVGYDSNNNCTLDYGFGYWPPGPECPTQDERTVYITTEPTPTTEACENGLGKVGIMVNGSSIYNWGDGMSYQGNGDWQNLAPVAEVYDVDICGGHAAGTDYHHHFYSSCLAELLGDDGTAHSPLWGYAADGYPIYGPWEADGVLAVSAWVTRDYDDPQVGCSDGARSCTLVDQYDVSQGTETASNGPAFSETVTSLSGNEFIATNGYYYEDYYWDSALTALGGAYLDQYNGHSDDERGYHYHITLTMDEDGNISPALPYIIGTRFAGELPDNAVASCSTGNVGGPPR